MIAASLIENCISTSWAPSALRCANCIAICYVVSEHYFSPPRTECANGIKYLSASARRGGGRATSVCPYYGLFDLCPVQMGCHALWFHKANATVTNDSGCDPMTGGGLFSRGQTKGQMTGHTVAPVRDCPSCPMKPDEGTVAQCAGFRF